MKTKSLSIFLVALFVVEMNLGTEEEIPFEEEKNNDDKNEKNKGIKYEIIKGEIPTYNFRLKTVLIGDDNVGKSVLFGKICKDEPFSKEYIPTIGIEYFTLGFKIVSDIGNLVLKYEIWDCCGQELYRSLVTSFYQNTSVFLLVYDVTNVKSFEDINVWLKTVKEKGPDVIEHFVLIGTKIDLKDKRVVSKENGEKFAKANGMKFVEVSAKTSDGIKKLEYILAKISYEEIKKYNIYEEFKKDKEKKEVEEKKKEEDDSEDDLSDGKKSTHSSSLCDCCKKICENC